ncbi:hypothetical protein [Curtobacterium ammoniigenes]|uniref:hypothetical protein n=1 Tax=Curtobacterium ammoniigenes TaxID=395387 RepID=UPI0008366D3B|nr:hypothetical protein [Curtobacterium ammoniigenes]
MTIPDSSPHSERQRTDDLVIVSPSMRRLAGFLWLVAILLLPVAALTRGPAAVLFALGPSTFLTAFAWFVLWRPHIRCADDALVIADVRRTTTMAWRRVQGVRDRYGIEIETSEGLRRAWVAPARSSRLAIGARRLTVAEAAERIRDRIPPVIEEDGPPPATVVPAPITTRVHGWTVALLVVLGLLASVLGARI